MLQPFPDKGIQLVVSTPGLSTPLRALPKASRGDSHPEHYTNSNTFNINGSKNF